MAKRSAKNYIMSVIMAWIAFMSGVYVWFGYTVQNASGHALGGMLFILFFWIMLIKPDWWEDYVRIMKGKQARKK